MDLPLVSVIIPVYNMEQFLEETLQSVLASIYTNFEIVVVDDGSTDKSTEIAEKYTVQYPRVKLFSQKNKGVSAARNYAISMSKGEFILPVDADNLISKDFISNAVDVLHQRPLVKVVVPNAEFFGDKTGEWKLQPFSLKLLARKNMMDTCAMYRKSDWERIGGYCEDIIAREDWDFWISMLKNGGEVLRLDEVGLYYRIRKNSKRINDRELKKHVIEVLNSRHKLFFKQQLGGKLHYNRSWSRFFNFIIRLINHESVIVTASFSDLEEFIYSLPEKFKTEGSLMHSGRNTLKVFCVNNKSFVVKSFKIPNAINRIIYGFLRKSKAKRSFLYAQKLITLGISTPEPVGFYEKIKFFLFRESYYACLQSECNHDFRDLITNSDFPDRIVVLKSIARFTANLHEKRIIHADYSAGNILFGKNKNNEIDVQLVDLNRLKFTKVNMKAGCKNFERLNIDNDALKVLAFEYAKARNFDEEVCVNIVLKNRWRKHKIK
ncbi:MAG: glycosyltransferase [Paludibacter sp.]|nr:glycosyltransferase [Paludibacter sp.]